MTNNNERRMMNIQAYYVIGANYGDEGKGKVSGLLCKKDPSNTLNILTNGGSQRGHTVEDDFGNIGHIRHIFHHFGAGTLYGTDNYYANSFITNPVTFRKEYEQLQDYGFDMKNINIYCNPLCRMSTPWDMMTNQMFETARNKDRHGSCGYGIWETVLRYRNIHTKLGKPDFISMSYRHQVAELIKIRNYFDERIHSETVRMPDEWKDVLEDEWRSKEMIDHYLEDVAFFYNTVKFCDLIDVKQDYKTMIFENGQGLCLDSDPSNVHTTPSYTGADQYIRLLRSIPSDKNIVYVTRSFITRHGAGPFPEESPVDVPADKTNTPNEWQGKIRYGRINMPELKNRLLKDFDKCKEQDKGIKGFLYVTHLDIFDNYIEFENSFKDTDSIEIIRNM